MMTKERDGLAFRSPVKREGWAQVYHVLTTDENLSDGAFRLYVLLLKYAQQRGGCWPGRERLARELGTTTRTIDRRLAELTERGLITRVQRGKGVTAMTWIEDLETVYSEEDTSPDKNVKAAECPDKSVEASPDKNVEPMTPTNLSRKEQEEEQTDMVDGGDTTKDKAIKTTTLTAFGVARPVAVRLARARALEEIQGWIDYAKRAEGLHNPVGLVVSRLRDGVPVPEQNRGGGQHRRAAPAGRRLDCEGAYRDYICT
ncbi:MAG: hypothetical protein GF383_16675 [Candidatus Lokiarchaeota archaeon]|nr:hypothetical protein [Candidatus Lokiarchaeota archaeon]